MTTVDIALRKYLGLDDWKTQPRDKFGKWTSSSFNYEKNLVKLSKEEYNHIVHELNNNLTKEQRAKRIVTKYIGNYKYIVRNNGFNDYEILKRTAIQ